MTTINDIMMFFEEFAPLESAVEYDNPGLIVGSKNTQVTSALVSLDITKDVVAEAEKLGCELIISHHPVIFNPVKKIGANDTVYHLISKNISALCMHTNLDLGSEFGVNTCLAEAVGVKNATLSEYGECMFTGSLEAETEIDVFAENVKKALNCEHLRYTDTKKLVKTVAVSSGAGGSNIFDAAKAGADVLVTGEIKHHEINAANELEIDIIDAGHFKSEDIVILPLINKLSRRFPEIKFTKSKVYSDKIKFI